MYLPLTSMSYVLTILYSMYLLYRVYYSLVYTYFFVVCTYYSIVPYVLTTV